MLMKVIVNAQTGERIERPLTEEEMARHREPVIRVPTLTDRVAALEAILRK